MPGSQAGNPCQAKQAISTHRNAAAQRLLKAMKLWACLFPGQRAREPETCVQRTGGGTTQVPRPQIHGVLIAESPSAQGAKLISMSLSWTWFVHPALDGYSPVLPFTYLQSRLLYGPLFLSSLPPIYANSSWVPVPSCNSSLFHPPFLALDGTCFLWPFQYFPQTICTGNTGKREVAGRETGPNQTGMLACY